VLVGHSERRHVYGESDALCAAKVCKGLAAGLQVCLCIGETLEEREAGRTEEVCRTQLLAGLDGLTAEQMRSVILAYEPVWAIGTGKTASPAQAGEVHAYLRGLLSAPFGQAVADATRILYGGSVKPGNAAELMAVPDIDGALVGGAALTADQFLPIIDAAAAAQA
jgi:triosephosphate isomerase